MGILERRAERSLRVKKGPGRRSLGTLVPGIAVAASCAYVLASLLSAIFHLGVSDRGGLGAFLFDCIWLSLAIAVVAGGCHLRIRKRNSPTLDGSTSYDELQATKVVRPSHALQNSWDVARKRRFTVPEAGGFVAVLAVYHGVFFPGAITWGDWGYYINAGSVRRLFPLPSVWSFADLGKDNVLGLPLGPVDELMGLMARLGVPYSLIERVIFYFPIVILPYLGMVVLLRAIGITPLASAFAGVLFATNTYALALISGGQVTVGMGYALAPWVALAALQLYRRGSLARGGLLGLLVGIQAWYDPREALLSCIAMSIVAVILAAVLRREALGSARFRDVAAAGLALGVTQLHWLLVAIFAIQPALPTGYTGLSSLRGLSYMSLGDGLTIFHPFWPFYEYPASIHVVPALWMAVPMTAALALLRRPLSTKVLSAVAVYLVFSALVSGATEPFAPVNSWLFSLPGLDVFRDPSPYFGPGVLAAAVLVGMALSRSRRAPANRSTPDVPTTPAPTEVSGPPVSARMPAGRSPNVTWQATAGVMVAGLFVMGSLPAVSGRLGDNLAPRKVPSYDVALARNVSAMGSGSVLWLPYTSRFAAKRRSNPTVSGWALWQTSGVLFPRSDNPLSWLTNRQLVARVLQRYGIRYVVLDASRAAYKFLSIPYGASLRIEQTALAGFPYRSFGPLTLYQVPSAPGAPFSLVGAHQVVDRQPAALQEQLSGALVSVAPAHGRTTSTATSRAFPNELGSKLTGYAAGKPSRGGAGYLSVAQPLQAYSVVEAELQGSSIMLRDVPTVASVPTGTHVLAATPHVPWQMGGVLSRTELRHGIVITVAGITHYLSRSALAGKEPVPVTAVPTSGSSLSVSVERLGRNLLGAQTFGGNLDGWGSLGNEDNSQHFRRLSSAGISATPGGACGSGALTLTARLDAAGITHPVPLIGKGHLLVIGAQVRRLAGSYPELDGFFQGGNHQRFAARTNNALWASVRSIVTGQLGGIQFAVFQGQHGGSVACLRDPYVREAVALGTILLPANTSITLLQRYQAGSPNPVTYQPPSGLAARLQLLSTTSFGNGLGAWGSLGDVDNYNRDTLAQAGIAATVTRLGGLSVLHLTVRSGAAGIDQSYFSWAASNVYRLSLTYRTSPGVSLTAYCYPRAGSPAAQSVGFPTSDGHWVTKTVEFYMAGTISSPATLAGTLELRLSTGGSRGSGSAYIRRVSLEQVLPHPVIVETTKPLADAHGSGFETVKWSAKPAGGDSFTVSVPSHGEAKLLVFWQSYSTGWKAVDSGGKLLVHVKVNGWANGFILEGAARTSTVRLTYQPQQWEILGLMIEFVVLVIAVAGLAVFALRRLLPSGKGGVWR